jgi:hypothetical protein
MPFASKSQQKFMHANPDVLGPKALQEWDQSTKKKKGGFAKLPEKAHPANGQHDHAEHLARTSEFNGHGQHAGDHATGSPCPASGCDEGE